MDGFVLGFDGMGKYGLCTHVHNVSRMCNCVWWWSMGGGDHTVLIDQ
jgi:hypothetical protein